MNYINFPISENNKISIFIPPFSEKINWYYEPTTTLNRFDEVDCFYEKNHEKILIINDIIGFILNSFSSLLNKALENKLSLPPFIKKSEFGKYFNEINYQITTADDENLNTQEKDKLDLFSQYWLFSGKEIQTWIYNVEDKICIEITPSYKWLYQDPKPNEKFISFKAFMQDYKPHAIFCIDKKTADQWKQKCDMILQDL